MIDILKFHLDACRIEPRFIERGLNDATQEELEEIYKTYVIPLNATWKELTPEAWTIISNLVKGSHEVSVLIAQRKALRNAWKTLIRSKNESKKNKANSARVDVQSDQARPDEDNK